MDTWFQRLERSLVVIGIILSSLVVSCDSWESVSFINQTFSSIKIDIRDVPLDYVGPPLGLSYDSPDIPIATGKSQRFLTSIPIGKRAGANRNYSVAAINEANQIVFFRVFTWDELHDMNWTVVITPTPRGTEQRDNVTGK